VSTLNATASDCRVWRNSSAFVPSLRPNRVTCVTASVLVTRRKPAYSLRNDTSVTCDARNTV